MKADLNSSFISTIVLAAKKLAGFKRRQFQAEMALKYCDGSPRQAERIFSWGRETVQLGLNELRTGIECLCNYSARGRHRAEVVDPKLAQEILSIVEPVSQTDPTFRSPLSYTRVTASAVWKELKAREPASGIKVPHVRTIQEILERMGYRLRRVRKTQPKKNSRNRCNL